ncbi:MAG: phosphatidate cytidylyltransferase [Sporichthyaceae bacterium]
MTTPPPRVEADAPPEKKSRAGRNLPAAVGVGVALGGTVAASLVIERALFVGVVAIAVLVALWELAGALGTKEIKPPLVPIAIGSVAMLIAAFEGGTESLVVGLALTILGLLAWRMPDGPAGFVRDVTAGVFVTVYVPFLAGFAVLMSSPDDGAERVATFVIVIVCNDVGGYAAGVLFGKHPMAPKISPKKSWEGMAGSLVACAAGGAVCLVLLMDDAAWKGVILGLCLAVAATVGDLGESLIKRDIGVKDMGSLLPGHGGLMDRLDSLLVAAPVAWLLLTLFVDPGGI